MDSILSLAETLLKEGERIRFKNERRKFGELVQTIMTKFPKSLSANQTLEEPYKSLAFLITVGQRPFTSLLLLKILLEAGNKPLNGKKIAEKMAAKLKIAPSLTTKGGNYQDRVGELISAFAKIGILEPVHSPKTSNREEEGFRIDESAIIEVKAVIDCIELKNGVLSNLRPMKLEDLFRKRFDQKIKYVIKSGTGEKERFEVGKIVESLIDPKVGVSFGLAIRLIQDVESKLKPGIETIDIQSLLYNSLRKYDDEAAESYIQTYPEVLSITMSNGESKIVNYKLVKTLIGEEVKLKLTSGMMDKFASAVYNVISKNPRNYQDETAVREYTSVLVYTECDQIEPDVTSYIRNHLESSISALNGCHNSIQSDEVGPARVLLTQFLEQICLVIVAQFGYLPLKNFRKNVEFISNLLKEEAVKEELETKFELDEKELFEFQRIKSMLQLKNTANKKSLEKLANEGWKLVEIGKKMLHEPSLYPQPVLVETATTEVLPDRITTGHGNLDSLLYGGIPKEYSIILNSPPCDERDIIVTRFLETGAKNGEVTFYITIDLDEIRFLAEEHKSNFYVFICNPQADTIIEDLPNVWKINGVENLTDISIALTSAFRRIDTSIQSPKRACIRIVSDVLLQHRAARTRKWLASLIPELRSKGFTTLAIIDSQMHLNQDVHSILDLFDGEIEIFEKESDLRRYLKVKRLLNKKYRDREIPLAKD